MSEHAKNFLTLPLPPQQEPSADEREEVSKDEDVPVSRAAPLLKVFKTK
jgi:hypothetical protein